MPDHDAFEIAGLVRAVFSCVLAVFMVYADGPNYPALKALMVKQDFVLARGVLCVLAEKFGFLVRYKLRPNLVDASAKAPG